MPAPLWESPYWVRTLSNVEAIRECIKYLQNELCRSNLHLAAHLLDTAAEAINESLQLSKLVSASMATSRGREFVRAMGKDRGN